MSRDTTQPDGPPPKRAFSQTNTRHPGVLAMRKLLVPAIAAAILATSAVAFAATKNTTGTVKAFDSKSITLTNGNEYMLPADFKDPGIKTGEKVTVAWDVKAGSKVAEKVTIKK
jgi:hypothetical protein